MSLTCRLLLIMKLVVLLILLSVTAVLADVSAQTVTLRVKSISLIEAMRSIQQQSGHPFFLSGKDLANIEVHGNIQNLSLDKALNQLLKGKPAEWILENETIVVKPSSHVVVLKSEDELTEQNNQRKTIAGRVTDENKKPIQGATVVVKGTNIATTTDGSGRYSLSVSQNVNVLVISIVGFVSAEKEVNDNTVINVVLEQQIDDLDEVLVVGYGMQKKVHITGSVAQINSQELNRTPMSNVSNMLTGKLPGLISKQTSGLPGSDQAALTIRGFGTFNDSSPLLLVDGVERSFNNLDPNDIESVTILKDAAAAAVYGVRAAHGVVLVRTKRGSTGDDVKISYNNSLSFSNNTRFPKFLDGVDYALWHNKARELDGVNGYFAEADIEKIRNGDPEGVLGNTNWLDLLFKDYALMQQHNVSAYGGTEKSQFFVSAGFMDQDGIIPSTSFKRYNIRSNVDVNISNDVRFMVNVAGRKEDTNHPGFAVDPNNGYNPISQAIRVLPVIPSSYDGLPTATGPSASTWSPVAAANASGFNRVDRYVFESSLEFEYKFPFLNGLSAKFFGNYDHNFTDQRNFLGSYYVNKFNVTDQSYMRTRADGTAELSSLFQGSSNGGMMTFRPTLQFQQDYGKHTVGAMLLYEYRETNGSSFQASRRDFLINDIPELSFAMEDVANSIRGSSSKTKIAGYVGRFNYAISDKYLAELAFRYDGSYKFHPNYRWGFFPSLSLGWMISEESFFQSFKIDKLKIRASVGELGKDNLDAFLYRSFFALTDVPVYAFGQSPLANYALYTTNSVPSSNLGWEKTRVINLGLETNLFEGKLEIEFDAFYKYTYDILQAVAGIYPPSISDNYQTIENSGKVAARGIELGLTHRNQIGKLFYQFRSNISWARNKVLSRVQSENIPSWQSIIGRPIGGVYGFQALGLYQTQEQLENRPSGPGGIQRLGDLMYLDYNGDGKIDNYDMVRIANSTTPEIIFSFAGDFTWKAFSFGFQLQGAGNSDVLISGLYPSGIMDQTEFARPFYEGGNAPYYLVEGAWAPDNREAKFPRLGEAWNGNNGWASSWWAYNGAYVRLKQAYVGVSVPQSWLTKAKISDVKLNLSGSNLFTWDYLKFMDPEMPSNNNGYYPQQRTFSLGVALTF